MSKINKGQNYAFLRNLALNHAELWTKVQMDNIVLPDMRTCRLLDAILAQVVKTKEQPQGCPYSSDSFRVVLRLLDGKVFIKDGALPDSYCWKHDKVAKAKSAKAVGYQTDEGKENTKVLLSSLSAEDQGLMNELFSFINADFLLVTTPEESRWAIEVTQELYDLGLTSIVDEWMDVDENGEANATILNVGDFIVVTNDGFYTIRRDEFLATHKK